MLKVENISKKFDSFELKDISFELETGFIMGLIGPNGSGKTTLIKIIMNLLKQDKGSIYFMGEDISKNPKYFKENIGFVYDNLHFYEHMKIKDFKNIIGDFYSNFESKKFDNYLDKFELAKNTKIKNLSKGQSIKLMLANAFSHNAKLLILDEPTSGLDPIFRKDMITLLQQELEDGEKSAIFSTHITLDLEQAADYITFINNGNLVFSESKEFINENYKIIKGTKETLDNLGVDFINRIDARYYSEGLFIKEGYKLDNKDIKIATLEDIIYYSGKGNINA